MRREDVLGVLESIASEKLGLSRALAPEERLVEDLELDSMRLLTLAIEVENRLEIRLDPLEEAEVMTVDDLVELVLRTAARRSPA